MEKISFQSLHDKIGKSIYRQLNQLRRRSYVIYISKYIQHMHAYALVITIKLKSLFPVWHNRMHLYQHRYLYDISLLYIFIITISCYKINGGIENCYCYCHCYRYYFFFLLFLLFFSFFLFYIFFSSKLCRAKKKKIASSSLKLYNRLS